MGRINFLLSVMRKIIAAQDSSCPYCGSNMTHIVQRKKVVLQLRSCQACELLFRYPKDVAEESRSFYQLNYREPTVTDLPRPSELPRHIQTNFASIARDLSGPIATMKRLKPSGTILDYGSSWGYGVHQFRAAGYDAAGYEISRPRAEFGRRHLNVTIYESVEDLTDRSFDILFSSHVLEHIPNPRVAFDHFRRLLKPSGLLMIFVPNAGGRLARELGTTWGPLICEKHVLALTAAFFERNLSTYGLRLLFGTSPYTRPPAPLAMTTDLDGEELMVIGQPELTSASTGRPGPDI
jgi:2-polyprenyl-3-methyl-5-hydroxy-6-metoxy-1,4-benzoquinol methylase